MFWVILTGSGNLGRKAFTYKALIYRVFEGALRSFASWILQGLVPGWGGFRFLGCLPYRLHGLGLRVGRFALG